MAHPLDSLLKRLRKTYAETVRAKVVSKISDGDYYCELTDTGEQVRASRGNIATELTAGQLVLLGRPDSTGRSYNTGYVIIGFPPGAAKGASAAPPDRARAVRSGASVSLIRPNPAELDAGGAAVAIDIYGRGLATAPAYGDPLLTDDSAPVIAADHITLSVKAGAALAAGDYDLVIGDVPQTIAGYFKVSSPPALPVLDLWPFYYDGAPKLAWLDSNAFTVTSSYGGGAAAWFVAVMALGGSVWARFAGDHILQVDAATGAVLGTFNGLTACTAGQSAHDDTRLFFFVNKTIVVFDTGSTAESTHVLDPSIANILAVDCDAAAGILFVGAGAAGLFAYSTATWAQTAVNAGYNVYQVCHDATYIYAITKGADKRLTKFLRADLSEVAQSVTLGAASTADPSLSLLLVNGSIYATTVDDAGFATGSFRKFDPATLAFTALAIGHQPLGAVYANGKFYVGDVAGGLTVIDEATFTIDARHDFSPFSYFGIRIAAA